MNRGLYEADHEAFRDTAREFVIREVLPHLDRWEEARLIDRGVWVAAGTQGILGLSGPSDFGGADQLSDYRFRNVLLEELAEVHATSLSSGFSLQDDIAIPYVAALGSDEQKARWLPGMCSGELIGAIAMTEPGTGSDLQGITTSARPTGDGWVVNGAKTFITNGIQSDVVIVVVRTDPGGGRDAFSLLVVEEDMPGFSRGRKLEKIGLHAQDTAELFFDDVVVPHENLLGELGAGMHQLATHLPRERLSIAAHAVASTRVVLRETLEYTRTRRAFGRRLADFQNTQFVLAELATRLDVTQAYVDASIHALNAGELTAVDAAKAKWWATDVQNQIVDACLQLHGGYGYMTEYPVARAFQDARVQRIFGGANEIMKHIIARDLVDRPDR
ncbi:acyl-CoA dehydrogenase family protein [Micromonospora olivasterospora]|uniref:Acyl-[acyl-carrier-protein] dehydrogenase MbtN n=1 Tax=Micromonospora olivasterospora TaxID=1880 RepID=A0A562I2W6_MICOL|nr:acyl-CoA dehydrogenase family protein [Micromonospora olivasterospora]TWH65302.1 long-chain-acyl-CoA dehydrogenase [Micromonospora olivasterospora]